jgi:hypothetical protein
MQDLYQENRDDSAHYIIGKNGEKKIFAIGLYPSTANREKSDTTVAKVEAVACKQLQILGLTKSNRLPHE